mgnify:FL=1
MQKTFIQVQKGSVFYGTYKSADNVLKTWDWASKDHDIGSKWTYVVYTPRENGKGKWAKVAPSYRFNKETLAWDSETIEKEIERDAKRAAQDKVSIGRDRNFYGSKI